LHQQKMIMNMNVTKAVRMIHFLIIRKRNKRLVVKNVKINKRVKIKI